MKKTPHFSVIIPTYREGNVIGDTLTNLQKSVDKSDFKCEIIVVDGGSDDNTIDVAKQHITKAINFNKRGIGPAKNFGASKSRGNILSFVDADIRVESNFFQKMGRIFEANGIAGANCEVKPAEEVGPTYFEKSFYVLWGAIKRHAYKLKPCGTGENGIFVKKQVFYDVNGFDETLAAIEDLDFMLRASKLGKFIYLREPKIYETIRRFRKAGVLRFSADYLNNWFYYAFFKESKIKEWKPIR